MSFRSAMAGTLTTLVLIGVFGSPALVDEAHDLAVRHDSPVTAATLTGFPNWDVFGNGTSAEETWGVILKLTVMVVGVALLTALAGRASRPSAFLAGWGSLVVAGGLAGAVYYAYQYAVVLNGHNAQPLSYLDNLTGAANGGAAFGLWTGWLVGAAVAVTARVPVERRLPATGPIARGPGRGHPVTPPAPWWAADASPASPAAVGGRLAAASVFPAPAPAAAPDAAPTPAPPASPAPDFATPASGSTATRDGALPSTPPHDPTLVHPGDPDATLVDSDADPTLVHGEAHGAHVAGEGHAAHVADEAPELDLEPTLATPLARRLPDGPDATRPIPAVNDTPRNGERVTPVAHPEGGEPSGRDQTSTAVTGTGVDPATPSAAPAAPPPDDRP